MDKSQWFAFGYMVVLLAFAALAGKALRGDFRSHAHRPPAQSAPGEYDTLKSFLNTRRDDLD